MKKHATYVTCLLLTLPAAWTMAIAQTPNVSTVVKMDAALDEIVTPDSRLELLVKDGFEGGEGPVWVQKGETGHLLFTGAGSRVYEWTPDCFTYPCAPTGTLTVFLEHSGQRDASPSAAAAAGANGLALDRERRLLLAAGGDRAILRLEEDGTRTTVADRYEGKRIGCPNDLAVKSDGGVYFTDGSRNCLPGGEPDADLPFHGVYFARNGTVQLLDQDPGGYPPNGIALSPNENILYVTNGGPMPERRKIFAYDVHADGTVSNRRLFLDLTGEQGLGGPDGVKVDSRGNVYSAATGGVWIASPAGTRLGKITAPEGVRFANLAFGDSDRRTLYLVGPGALWRIRLNVPGSQ
ncbi:MAG: SMP-30/gluconolactonase/LRE family protein [Acidobacteria bacterium]|nr:SMP-30/gluconolactonase/LRE family protein [Acidobacteriota bacterium]